MKVTVTLTSTSRPSNPSLVTLSRLDIGLRHSFLQRVSIACYAEGCISYSKSVRPSVRPSVCPSVRHMLALCQNDSSYDHAVFRVG